MSQKSAKSGQSVSELLRQARISTEDLHLMIGVPVEQILAWETGRETPAESFLRVLRTLARSAQPAAPQPADFRFIDLFAGIGGIRKAFEEIGGRCVFTSEWNRFARQTYEANFRIDHEINGDIREVPAPDVPDHDVLLAGFPCQPFSIAGVSKKNALGKRHGFACEAQGTLFFDIARILREKRPAAFLLENVKNLLSHDRGNTFRVIHQTLTEELGYTVSFRVLDAKGLLPQHRERTIIVGFRDPAPFSFDEVDLGDRKNGPRMGLILHPQDGSEQPEEPYTVGPKARVAEKYILTDHLWNYLQRYAEKHRAKGNGFGFGLVGPDDVARTLSARYYKDGSEILVARKRGNPRRLTPRECSRLMGFDSPGESKFVIPVSDTQAYKQFGNSVAVPVMRAVATAMKPWLDLVLAGKPFPRVARPQSLPRQQPLQFAP